MANTQVVQPPSHHVRALRWPEERPWVRRAEEAEERAEDKEEEAAAVVVV
jgi:hypothetical protein